MSLAAGLALALGVLVAPLAQAQQAQQPAAAAPQGQPAQGGGKVGAAGPFSLPAADQQTIKNYALNEDVFSRMIATIKDVRAANIKPQQAPPDPAKIHTLDDLVNQAVSSDPRIVPLIKKHGFTPREFLLTNLAVMNAALGSQAKKNPNLASQLDQSMINPSNVAFFEAHQSELAQLAAQQQPQPAPGGGG